MDDTLKWINRGVDFAWVTAFDWWRCQANSLNLGTISISARVKCTNGCLQDVGPFESTKSISGNYPGYAVTSGKKTADGGITHWPSTMMAGFEYAPGPSPGSGICDSSIRSSFIAETRHSGLCRAEKRNR